MLRITVTKEGGSPQVSTFDKREITVGRTTANDLVIAEPGVSSHHARILFTGDGVTLIDLESTNGTFVNGDRIRGPALVEPGDEVYICAYRLDFELGGSSSQAAPPLMEGPPPMVGQPPMMEGPPPMVGQPPMSPEYPTPADLGPPPLGGSASSDGPPPMIGGGDGGLPPMLDMPPLLEAPPPVQPGPAPVEAMPPIEAPPPIAAPPPVEAPPPLEPPADLPPPIAPPPVAPPAPVEDDRPSSLVSGQISPLESPPPAVAPTPPPDIPVSPDVPAPSVMPAEPTPAPIPRPTLVSEPTPTPMPIVAPLGPAPVSGPSLVAYLPQPAAAVVAPPPSEDLSDLKGPGAGPQACSRVFALVRYHLAPDGSLPHRDATTRAQARGEAQRLFTELAERVPEIQARPWANRLANELCGLGALSAPLAETGVRSIFVHGPGRVLVLREGEETPTPADAKFSCPEAVELVVRRLTGRPFGPEHPLVDARSSEGADVRAIHGSLTSPGPLVTIHRARVDAEPRGLEALVQRRALPSGMATLLCHCVHAGLNILVCGGPGARVFSWLAALAAEAPPDQRQVFVRPGPEPEPLPANAVVIHSDGMPLAGAGFTGAQQAMRAALALAPDRLVAHDVAGPEASDVVAAMGRSLSGALVSLRASSADAGLSRLAALAGLTGDAPDAAARARQVAQTVDVVLAVSRFADGRTRVTQLAEATVSSAGTAQAVELVTYQPNTGRWSPTGVAPSFFAALQRRGIAVDVGLLGE
ncbi:MAG: Flp pilus assembly complex ATPase component TadA [Myxococcales bacterium]|nr:Flp pilus assembly complex ATPase component TadA [Myxococcales bacterium]